MYGTVARMKCKPGAQQAVLDLFKEGDAQKTTGFVASYCYRLDKDADELIITVVFQDKKTYFANADDPETDKWYKRLRENLAADPEWNDGEIAYAST